MSLSDEEIERYARHLVLREVGGQGQAKLKAARVLVVGAGGLGTPLLQYLAAAGVGTLGVVDDDTVSLSNLQRQVIHGSAELGTPKVASAAAAVARINPHVAVEVLPLRLTREGAGEIVRRFDVVADGSDNFDTRYAVSDACFYETKTAGHRCPRRVRRIAHHGACARAWSWNSRRPAGWPTRSSTCASSPTTTAR